MPVYLDVTNAAQETATKILAQRRLGRAYHVTIGTGGGATAAVSWDHARMTVTMQLPSLPATAWLSRAEADRVAGFIVHECCHVLHTSRTTWELAVRDGERVALWTNCLEDVRIERLEIDRGAYPAMRGLLGRVADSLYAKARASGLPIGGDVSQAAHIVTILGRIENGYAIPSAAGLERAMSKPVARLVRRALAGLSACQNTSDVLALARKLAKAEATAKQQQQEEQQQGDEGQGQGDEGQGQGEGARARAKARARARARPGPGPGRRQGERARARARGPGPGR
jgi:hypothetical protein